MSRKKTQEEFVSEMNDVNPDIKIIGEYVSAVTKIKCNCLICSYEWDATPNHLLNGKGCPKCAKTKIANALRKSDKTFIGEIRMVNPNIKIVGKYINNKTKVDCRCSICNNEWSAIPLNLLRGEGCPKCANNKKSYTRRKNTKEFVDRMKSVNPNIKIIGKYVKSNVKIECQCLICGNEWMAKPNHLLNNRGCPFCEKSKGECKIERFLKDNGICYTPQKKFNNLIGLSGRKLSYDFYIPYCNVLIEFNGLQHEKPIEYFGGNKTFVKQQEHDKRKREYAKEHNIDLLEIWYYDYDNIEQILNEKLHTNNTEKSA